MFNKDYGLMNFIKLHKFGPKLYKTSQVWAQTCEHLKVQKFKLVSFTKGHKFGPNYSINQPSFSSINPHNRPLVSSINSHNWSQIQE